MKDCLYSQVQGEFRSCQVKTDNVLANPLQGTGCEFPTLGKDTCPFALFEQGKITAEQANKMIALMLQARLRLS